MRRMWINQPSTLQPLHHMHGTNVLAGREYRADNAVTVYLLEGDVVSMYVPSLALSPGWRPVDK